MAIENQDSPDTAGKPGRPPAITLKVVKRVGAKVAQGVPLRYALAAENNREINLDSWHKAIQRNDDFRAEYERAGAAFVEAACKRLVADRSPANLRWILERRYPADFARKPDTEVNVNQTIQCRTPEQNLALELARARARPGERVDSADDLAIELARMLAQDGYGGRRIENQPLSAPTMAWVLKLRQEHQEREKSEEQERSKKKRESGAISRSTHGTRVNRPYWVDKCRNCQPVALALPDAV